MSYSEMIRVGLFLAAMAAVPVFDVYLLLRHIRRTAQSDQGESEPERKGLDAVWVKIAAGIVTVVGVGCISYGWLVEPGWLKIEEVKILTDKLPEGESLKIVFMSDLHIEPGTRVMNAAAIASMQNPDIILLGGDYMNGDTRDSRVLLKSFLVKLKAKNHVFGVSGNWDGGEWKSLLSRGGASSLGGRTLQCRTRPSGRGSIAIQGFDFGDLRPLDKFAEDFGGKSFTIALHHSPDVIGPVKEKGIDLLLAGHTHGGQVRLPGYGALVTLSEHGKKYEAGRYDLGSTTLYVTRGLGMEGGAAPRVRFCCRPEITVINIEGTGK